MGKPRTAAQKAALRKAQLASARKRRKHGGTVKRSSGNAFKAGLALGSSKSLNRKAGINPYGGRRTKKGTADKRYGIRKNVRRRSFSYAAGAAISNAAVRVAVAGAIAGGMYLHGKRKKKK